MSTATVKPEKQRASAAPAKPGRPRVKRSSLFGKRPPNTEEILWFVRQLGSLYKAGVPLATAISLIRRQSTQPVLAAVLQDIEHDLRDGLSLAEAVARHARVFPPLLCGAVTAGEKGGILEEALDNAHEWLSLENETVREVRKAFFYPGIVSLAFVGAVVAVLTLVVPAFRPLFANLGDNLPLPTRVLLVIDNVVSRHGIDLLVILVGLVAAARFLLGRDALLDGLHRLAWHLPKFGPVLSLTAQARLAATVGLLQKAGLPLVKCLEIGHDVIPAGPLKKDVGRLRAWVIQGGRFSEGVAQLDSFSLTFRELAAIGESAGQLDQLMLELAGHYCLEVRDRVQRLTRLLEPALTTALALFVLGLALAIFSPYWRMLDAMQ